MKKILIFMLFVASCSFLTKSFDSSYYEEITTDGKNPELQILFSHNINGETHPCGCRHNPLGGLSQVAGEMYSIRKEYPTLYVDTGDTFFPSAVIPEAVKKSLSFKAQEIAYALKRLGLKFFVPGDQDFALGVDFLNNLLIKNEIDILVSNFNSSVNIKHKKWTSIKFGDQHIFLIGVINPELLSLFNEQLVTSAQEGIKSALKEIDQKFPNQKNKKIILLSHSGIDEDKILAKTFPQIEWIIGAHSQSFLRFSVDIGKTKIAQTLSRNHYLGNISIPSSNKQVDKYKIIEVRDELAQKWKDNPYISWLIEHKKKLEAIQFEEQDLSSSTMTNHKAATVNSCIDCHSKQTEFWQGTAHSISYYTLVQNNEQFNSSCIGCHSLEYQSPKGFSHPKSVVTFESGNQEKKIQKYIKELGGIFTGVKSIRQLNTKTRQELADKWSKIDQKFEVKHNFANVQCLNCHGLAKDHPFDDEKTLKGHSYENQCIKCHTSDQSPEWYNKSEKGIASKLNIEYFAKKLKSVSCPKN